MHFILLIVAVAIIIALQLIVFEKTLNLTKLFKGIFSPNEDDYWLSSEINLYSKNEEEIKVILEREGFNVVDYIVMVFSHSGLPQDSFKIDDAKSDLRNHFNKKLSFETHNDNKVFKEIQGSINSYLEHNKEGVSDYYLIKDIVDRNCDAVEEEIDTQIPIPLYLGLVGTMFGIIVGVGFLWIGGGLNELLNSGSDTDSSVKGIQALLGGVALAMISSIVGIILTTIGSMKLKKAKVGFEANKHVFLSWLQKKLLPSIKSDVSGALVQMSRNLNQFNSTFSTNTVNLNSVLAEINKSYKEQRELVEAVSKLSQEDLPTKNIELYKLLKASMTEVDKLTQVINNSSSYLEKVKALNDNIYQFKERTRYIEYLSEFFRKHDNWLVENYEQANKTMIDTVEKYNQSVTDVIGQMKETLEEQILMFANAMHEQQKKLNARATGEDLAKAMEPISKTMIEIKNLLNKQNQKTNTTNIGEGLVPPQVALKKSENKHIKYLLIIAIVVQIILLIAILFK